MESVNACGELPFLLRPGPNDRFLLDRLLSPDLFCDPIQLDGLVIEARRTSVYADLRPNVPKGSTIIVDPQVYRLQRESFLDQPSLTNLPNCPANGTLRPTDFETEALVSRFVTQVLGEQEKLGVSTYVAPAFFMESLDSPWRDVNTKLLKETRKQAGAKMFATLCGSYSGLCAAVEPAAVVRYISEYSVEGVLVLLSPIRALADSPTKLTNFVRLLECLRGAFGQVIACRQPAFGLGCMALGVAGFDSGIGAAEQFDYAALTRPQPKPHDEPLKLSKGGRPLRKMIYLPQLLTAVPYSVADTIFSTSGVAGSFVCGEPCCRQTVKGALIRNREHFLYTRLNEVAQMRSKPQTWRTEHLSQLLIASRQMAEKVVNAFPDTRLPSFRHLDVWSRVLAGATADSMVR